jgi:transcriptional regulator with XRE-family HTH domain
MTQSHWADIEGGRRSPTLDTLARVAAALGCQVRDLV